MSKETLLKIKQMDRMRMNIFDMTDVIIKYRGASLHASDNKFHNSHCETTGFNSLGNTSKSPLSI